MYTGAELAAGLDGIDAQAIGPLRARITEFPGPFLFVTPPPDRWARERTKRRILVQSSIG
jgi:hypothetical protein